MSDYYRVSNANVTDHFHFRLPGFHARIATSRYCGDISFQHCETVHRVFVTLEGGTRTTIAEVKGERVVTRPDMPGSVTVVPSGTARSVCLSDGDMTFVSIAIHPSFALDEPRQTVAAPALLQNGRDDWLARAAYEFSDAASESASRMQLEALANAMARYIGKARKGSRGAGLDPAALRRVVTLMQDAMTEDLSLSDLATECGLSVSAFGRAFRQSMGQTPHRHFTGIRMARAKTLLRRARMPLADIAASAGYSDQAHFTAAFTRHEGMPPARWRRAHQA